MPTTRGTRTGLPMFEYLDPDWHLQPIEMRDMLDAVNSLGALAVRLAEYPSASLDVNVLPGDYRKADGTVGSYAGVAPQTLAASGTRYLWLTNAGALTVGSAWPTSGFYLPLAVVVVGASTITSVTDARTLPGVVSGGPTRGTATLVAGTVTISTAAVETGSFILHARKTAGGTLGNLSLGTVVAGTSFVINSSSGSDTSTINWAIL